MHIVGEVSRSAASRANNFDLIRLVAAAQVVLWHGIEHLDVQAPPALLWMLGLFPGVPIFFVVSGYLVTASYRRTHGLRRYFTNRALRIFPALWVCFVFTFLSIAIVHGLDGIAMLELGKWTMSNLVGIAYTPAFLHDFGTGSVNGSLWTIPVELQFYVVLPMLVAFLARSGSRWVATFLVCLLISLVYVQLVRGAESRALANIMLRALPTWLYMFMLGMLLELRSDWVQRFMADRFLVWLAAYVVWVIIARSLGVSAVGNAASPIVMIPLAGVVLSAAHSHCDLANQLLRHHDMSYGVYLYHIPIFNLIIATAPQLMNSKGLALSAVLTGAAAAASWIFVERPALRRKALSRPRVA